MHFEQVAMKTPLVRMNIKDLPIEHKENFAPLLEFPISSYTKLFRGREIPSSWVKTFELVNVFLSETDIVDQIKIAQFLIIAHDSVIKFFSEEGLVGISKLTQDLGDKLNELDLSINLCDRLKAFIVANVPIGDFSKAGTRDQDTASLTFREHEAKELLSIVLLNKLLTPLFGVFIEYSKKKLDTQLKEVHCVTILTPLIRRKFFGLMTKLQNYIKHTINSKWSESPTSVFHSHTLDSMSEIITATIIVKDFVNVDLFYKDGNLMKYINAAAKHSIMTNRTSEKNPIYPRLPMSATDGDDGNIAQLEIDSATSIKMFDTTTIVKSAIQNAVYKLIDTHEIENNLYTQCVQYYKNNLITPSTINQIVTISYFSNSIGGGKGISFLSASEYAQLIAITQIVMFKLGYHELAHMLTVKHGSVKMIPTDLDNRIKVTCTTSDEFRNCKTKYDKSPIGADGTAWTNKINKVVQDITSTNYIYNTADQLWDIWDNTNLNDKIVVCSENIIPALCSFVELV